MKTDATYKRAFNAAVDLLRPLAEEAPLPSENRLAQTLHVSRTTARKVLQTLEGLGHIRQAGRQRLRTGRPIGDDKFPLAETIPVSTQIETRFLEWMLQVDAKPGTAINELDLSRRFSVATNVIREFLNRFQRFGLIERRIGSGWEFRGFTTSFARELFDVREMFEIRSARAFAALPESSSLWPQLEELRQRHVALLAEIDLRFQDFSELDSQFHRLINSVLPNRFIDSFYEIISMIFHYHYQWDKQDERARNKVAAQEHLAFIDALQARDLRRSERACSAHLKSARETLMRRKLSSWD
jgi:DNA-binding GntR family transcriptional regulator